MTENCRSLPDRSEPQYETHGTLAEMTAERDSWRRVAERLEREKVEAHENLDVALYHAGNLQRVIDGVPVRDLDESQMAFENVQRVAREALNGGEA